MMPPRTIRFWIFSPAGGNVRLTLIDGQTLAHSRSAPTEEGWTRETTVYTFENGSVFCDWQTDGRDCDGRVTNGGRCYFHARDRAAGYRDPEDGATFPEWTQLSTSHRDYSAEAANY